MLGQLAEAEDVVQDAYVKAFDALSAGKFDGRSRVETWLYRIVTRQAIDALRARKRRPKPTDVGLDVATDAHLAIESRVALAELDAWLSVLPDDQRAALVLSTLEGLSNAEVARVMDCSEGAVEQRLVRARATLRNQEGKS